MIVKDLIDKLQSLIAENPEVASLDVTTEGCDCDGDVGSVVVKHVEAWRNTPAHSYVYLQRS